MTRFIANFMASCEDQDLQIQWNTALRISRELQAYVDSLPKPLNPAPGLTILQSWTQEEQAHLVHLTQQRDAAWLGFASELLHHQFPHFESEVDALVKGASAGAIRVPSASPGVAGDALKASRYNN